MEERDGIPEDIMEVARKLARDEQFRLAAVFGTAFVDEGTVEAIARAIQAERERCAKIVKEGFVPKNVTIRRTGEIEPFTVVIWDEDLADAIRNP